MKVEDTKIYAVLKEVFGFTPEWKEVYENLKKVVDTNNYGNGFANEDRLLDCFMWAGNLVNYWSKLDDKCLEFQNKQNQKETMKTDSQSKEPELISMDKEYTCNGDKVRILCIDRDDKYSVVDRDDKYSVVALINNECIEYFTKYGQYYSNGMEDYLNLKECNPWQDVAVDTKICINAGVTFNCHFAKYEDGRVYYFTCGKTSFTADEDEIDSWPAERVTLAE